MIGAKVKTKDETKKVLAKAKQGNFKSLGHAGAAIRLTAKRQVLAKALAKLKTFQTKAVETASKRLDDPKLDQQLEQILSGDGLPALTPGNSSGNSPASSASSPAL